MKNKIQIFLVIMLTIGFSSVIAQDRKTSVGPAPNLDAVASNYTKVNTSDNPASLAYAFEQWSHSTLKMPLPAGSPFTTLSVFFPPEWSFVSSMTKGGNGNYYLITCDENNYESALYLFNNTTGVVTPLGSISGIISGEFPNGISYNPANTTYYLITRENLYSFNITTRVATLIGNMGILNSLFIDLCFNEGGACYAYDIATNASYIINPATGAATYLGPLGYLANYAQGMSYDMETSTIYLSAFNFGLNNGELRVMDPGTGATTLLTSWGNQEIAAFALNTTFPSPSTINLPAYPSPQNGATNISLSGNTATWTNGTGTTEVEIWFGSVGNVAKVYDGPAINSYTLPTLEYDTKYLWWIVCKNATGKTQGLPWTFTTVQDPNLVVAFYEPFNNLNCWTPIGPLGQQNWFIYESNVAGGSPPTELVLFYDPSFTGLTQLMSCPINSSTSYLNQITFMIYYDIYISAGPLIGVAVTYDDGVTSSMLWEELPLGDIVAEQRTVTFTPTSNSYRLIFYLNGNIFLINQWNIDDVQVDYVVPVELTSFKGSASEGLVDLSWLTQTETNNSGFEVERSTGDEFSSIAFVEGHGTTTEPQAYSYFDRSVNGGKYSYRLKQIDFDGSFKYSNIIEVDVPMLSEFSLAQNYPNPFNPSTTISFRLAADSKVTLKVFNLLGEEVAVLVNANIAAGSHNVDFDASNLNSGIYLYRIEAVGIDGTNFLDVKKMMLLK